MKRIFFLALLLILFLNIKVLAINLNPNYELINASGEALAGEIERNGSSVNLELNNMLKEYENLDSSEDAETIDEIKSVVKELISAVNSKGKSIDSLYPVAYAASVAYMYMNGYELSSELLIHFYYNTKQKEEGNYKTYYVPIHKSALYHSTCYYDYFYNGAKLTYSSKDNPLESDCYYSLHGTGEEIKYNNGVFITDLYDFDKEDNYGGPIGWVNDIMYEAQEKELALPFYIKFQKLNPHTNNYEYKNNNIHKIKCPLNNCNINYSENHEIEYQYYNESYHYLSCWKCSYRVKSEHTWIPYYKAAIKGYICNECGHIKLN